MAEGGKFTVTEAKADTMTQKNLEALNSAQQGLDNSTTLPIPSSTRPTLTTQHSNSLPSTPYVSARKLSDDYNTPSPQGKALVATSSPRSARSESDSTLRSAGRPPYLGGCKYETGMAYSRRRIPYSLGGDLLSPAKQVKKSLDPADEERLSGDMRELYDRLLPSADGDFRRTKLVSKLEKILNDKWPGNDIKVHVFGSSGNLLCSNDSDVDICITTPMKALERMCLLAKTLADHGMERVVCVPSAKVPIVKIWDPDLQLACDMNVNNTLALENTRMMRTYVLIDPRVRELAMVIKYWTRRRILNDAALGGTLSSYTWICLIVNFLQTRKLRVLPTLQGRPHQCLKDENGKLSPFADDLESLRDYGRANKETIGELLFHFFRRYGHELDYEKNVISVREGGLIPKKAKSWHLANNNRLCVEEPFNTDRNLGNTLDDIAFRGVHLELRRAFDLISQGKLAEACEQYEYPAQEEKIWTKPPPQPRPILVPPPPPALKERKNHHNQSHNSRNQNNHKGRNNKDRRSSSTTPSTKFPPFSPMPGQQPLGPSPAAEGMQIHDQLIQHYALLQAQEQHLRMQMHQRQQANLHAQATANLQTIQMPVPSYPHQRALDSSRRQSVVEPGPLSAPLRTMQGLYYPMPAMSPSQGSRSPQLSTPSQSTTNPPSPSLSVAQAMNGEPRRSMQRSLTTDNIHAATRSHSQPPSNSSSNRIVGPRPSRAVPSLPYSNSLQSPMLPYLHQYQQVYLQGKKPNDHHQAQNLQPAQVPSSESQHLRPMATETSEEPLTPRQYVGYYADPQLQPRFDRDGLIPPIPAYHDLANRSRRASASPNLSRLRPQHSRSPSPSHNHLVYDPNGVYVPTRPRKSSSNLTAYDSLNLSLRGRQAEIAQSVRSGPIIVDGSSDASEYETPPESLFFTMSKSETASLSDEHACDTPSSTSVVTAQEPLESFALEPAPNSRLDNSVPNILHFGEFPVRTDMHSSRSPLFEEKQTEHAEQTPVPSKEPDYGVPSNGLGIDFTASGSSQGEDPVAGQSTSLENTAVEPQAKHIPQHAPSPIPLPLLSPVREVRTPSPTTTRHNSTASVDTVKPTHNRTSSLAKELASSSLSRPSKPGKGKEKAFEPISSSGGSIATNGTAPVNSTPQSPHSLFTEKRPTNAASTSVQAPQQPSGWQQTVSKKNKKNRKASSVGSVPLMQELGERKGG